jgi:hypothetical protein
MIVLHSADLIFSVIFFYNLPLCVGKTNAFNRNNSLFGMEPTPLSINTLCIDKITYIRTALKAKPLTFVLSFTLVGVNCIGYISSYNTLLIININTFTNFKYYLDIEPVLLIIQLLFCICLLKIFTKFMWKHNLFKQHLELLSVYKSSVN